MKFKLLLFILFSMSSAYSSNVFEGSAVHTTDISKRFDALEISGIRMIALEEALSKCFLDNRKCAIKYTEIDRNRIEDVNGERKRVLAIRAIVHGLDSLFNSGSLNRSRETISARDNWSRGIDSNFNYIEEMGIKYEALSQALNQCFEASFDLCSYVSAYTTALNLKTNGSTRASAEATVRGYKIQ